VIFVYFNYLGSFSSTTYHRASQHLYLVKANNK
jgi:hypothetical protein